MFSPQKNMENGRLSGRIPRIIHHWNWKLYHQLVSCFESNYVAQFWDKNVRGLGASLIFFLRNLSSESWPFFFCYKAKAEKNISLTFFFRNLKFWHLFGFQMSRVEERRNDKILSRIQTISKANDRPFHFTSEVLLVKPREQGIWIIKFFTTFWNTFN